MSTEMRNRLKRREIEHGIRFITFSCYQRLGLLSKPAIADLFVRALVIARARFEFELFAWVIMPEHVHLLIRPGNTPVDRILLFIKMSVAKRVIRRWQQLNAPILTRIIAQGAPRFWQAGGGFDRNVRDTTELSKEIRYIHRNPVERGLVPNPRDWKWSSVRWWLGEREGEVECDPPPSSLQKWNGFV